MQVLTTSTVVDVRTFWQVVGLRAVGAAIVAAEASDGPRGFLALSPTHLSADPPIMMVSVDKKTTALETILEAGHFAINYLSTDQAPLVASFAGKGDLKGAERFLLGSWTSLVTGAPVLKGASGVIECTVEETIERYGAVIVIGRVVGAAATEGTAPLVHYKGQVL